MRFEWDEKKSRANREKHRISFETAIEVFEDPLADVVRDPSVSAEERFRIVGRLKNLFVVLVVHTYRVQGGEEVIRIISARKATPRERRVYEEAHF
jgi:uncharacterized protein